MKIIKKITQLMLIEMKKFSTKNKIQILIILIEIQIHKEVILFYLIKPFNNYK